MMQTSDDRGAWSYISTNHAISLCYIEWASSRRNFLKSKGDSSKEEGTPKPHS